MRCGHDVLATAGLRVSWQLAPSLEGKAEDRCVANFHLSGCAATGCSARRVGGSLRLSSRPNSRSVPRTTET